MNSSLPLAYIGKAVVLCKTGKVEEAMKWFEKGIYLEKKEDVNATDWLNEGGACYNSNASQLRESISRRPLDSQLMNYSNSSRNARRGLQDVTKAEL